MPRPQSCATSHQNEGIWDNDKIRGRGRYTILTGEKGGSADTVKLRVFGY